jgi:hypothetical protein
MPSTPKPAPSDETLAKTSAPALTNKQRRKLSKREQAAYSLEMVEVRRREARVRQIRRRVTVVMSILLVVGIVSTGAGLIVWNTVRAGQVGPSNMLSDGILLTGSTNSTTNQATITPVTTLALQPDAKPVATNLATYTSTANIALYLDFASPKTAQFWAANGTAIENWLGAGYITLEAHPVATSSTAANDYSSRAANAAACVAANDANSFLGVTDALLRAASTKTETKMTTAKLVAVVKKAGVTDTTTIDCINGNGFGSWVVASTTRATHGGLLNAKVKTLKAAPLVVVNKTPYTGSISNNTELTTFISNLYADAQSSSSGSGSGATSTPTPTATPTPAG